MAHWSSPTSRSRSPASRFLGESFAGSLSGGMAPPGGTPTPNLPPLGIASGLLIPCAECGGLVVEYIPPPGAGNLCERCQEDTARLGGCSFFKTQDEYEAIPRDRGLFGPAATPEQGQGRGCYLTPASSGFLIPERVGNPEIAVMEDLKHEMVAQRLAIAQLKTDIEDFMGKRGAGDKVQKVAKTDSLAHWAKAIVKWFFVSNAVVLLFGILVAICVK